MSEETHNQNNNTLEQKTDGLTEKYGNNNKKTSYIQSWVSRHPTVTTILVTATLAGGAYGISKLNEVQPVPKKATVDKEKTIDDKTKETSVNTTTNPVNSLNRTYHSESELRKAFNSEYNKAVRKGLGASKLTEIRQAYRIKAKNNFKAK